MKRLIIATKNKGKVLEIMDLLKHLDFEVVSLIEAGIHEDIVEDGQSFEENALIKALAIHRLTGSAVLADDSGLEIDFLNYAPGIYTARFLGEDATDQKRYKGVLAMLDGIPEEFRAARFVCAASLVSSNGNMTTRGTLEGMIAYQASGVNGFGYDPIFWVPEYNKTLADLDSDTKNQISHRAKAFKQIAERMNNLL